MGRAGDKMLLSLITGDDAQPSSGPGATPSTERSTSATETLFSFRVSEEHEYLSCPLTSGPHFQSTGMMKG